MPKKRKDAVSSKYIGVVFVKNVNKFRAKVTYKKETVFEEYFYDELEAAKARDIAALKFHGKKYVKLNFSI